VLWLAVAVFIWRAVVVIPHTHPDGGFQAQCPACHTDRAVSQAASVSPAADLVAALILLGYLAPPQPVAPTSDTVESDLPVRGPPLTA